VLRLMRNKQKQFMRESGRRVHSYETGVSSCVAAIAIALADWSLEYSHPIPPKMHVSWLPLECITCVAQDHKVGIQMHTCHDMHIFLNKDQSGCFVCRS